MKNVFRTLAFLLTMTLLCASDTLQAAHSSNGAAPNQTIDQLIAQLGDEQYLNRRSAELRLIELSADAFDALQAAASHSDLEIASRAAYILHRIRIDWVRSGDSAEVQTILQNYGNLSTEERSERIVVLGELKTHHGLRALCRIARYDPSPLLARTAALGILRSEMDPVVPTEPELAALATEIQGSRRVPVEWIRLYVDQLKQPDEMGEAWLPLIDTEIELLKEESTETSEPLVRDLLQFHLERCARFSHQNLAFETLERWVDMLIAQGARESESLVPALLWVLENQQWETLEAVEAHYPEQMRSSRLLIYLAAMARTKQGKIDEAEEFAEQAFGHEEDSPAERFLVTAIVEDLGRHDWAEREWRYLVETLPIVDETSRRAREQLAALRLHDRGEDRAAAELLIEYCDAVEADPALKKSMLTDRTKRYFFQRVGSQRDFFLACHAEQQGDFAKQRQLLDAAIKVDPFNADVLIAMYRSKNSDVAYRKRTAKLIREVSKRVESNIQQDPGNAQWYNHWAWLVSNTKGDYAKAVKYSLHSLELSPDSPSLLDTLGRCYYATGDLENAIKVQRQAIEGHPHLLVMRRQLELFENQLAKQSQE
ncbi:MAG: hypothetical protein GXP28_03935 [Planctomycetes bacterium]|nr:hypothetical protein [Planctomycetota bacterium]